MTRPTTFAELTTFRVGGPIKRFSVVHSREDFIKAVRDADEAGLPLLVIGGGSNIVAADAGFDGHVVKDMRRDISSVSQDGRQYVTATAGVVWDDFVKWSITQGFSGLEALSGIPGTVGAAPVQNIGAYGQDVSATLAWLEAWDRGRGEVVTLTNAELGLSYRHSMMKESVIRGDEDGRRWGPTGRWVILSVTFVMEESSLSAPILYAELARHLSVEVGERADAQATREAVLTLRCSKGMVLNEEDHDTWSAGSFFTNPILSIEDAERLLPADAPRFPAGEGLVKTSAAWLISHAGFSKGWKVNEGAPASLSTRHVLALTNRGEARAEDIAQLARAVREGVVEAFGVELVPEPVWVNHSL
ncbi:MAG: UDP-N-acetylenolpyruvoylglucosamine reductase [Actinobacteria bacterium]|nr:MAG: UDP-N-acetylenolpyruvoylglucosamine reductase [Actinomycetota bacterium]